MLLRGNDRPISMVAVCAALLTLTLSPSRAQEPVDTLTVPAGERLVLELETPLHTKVTRADDRADFYASRDLVVGRRVVVPEGSRIRATVVSSKRAGRVRGRAELLIRFDGVVFPDGSHQAFPAMVVDAGYGHVRSSGTVEQGNIEGEGGTADDARLLAERGAEGAAIGFALGRQSGAFYGGAVGVGVGIVGIMLERGPDLDLPRGTVFEVELTDDLVVPASVTRRLDSPVRTAEMPNVPTSDEGRRAEQSVDVAVAEPVVVSAPEPMVEERHELGALPAPSHTMRVDVGLVMVDTVVRGLDGKLLGELDEGDFRIFEDGIEYPVRHFSRDELPLAVALVVDRSGSEASYMPELRHAAEVTLSELKDEDTVALFSFSAETTLVEELTTDRSRLSRSLRTIRPGGSTDIVAALETAATYLAEAAPDRRRAIILISDNQNDGWNGRRQRDLVELLLETGTIVYSLRTSGQNTPFGGWKMAVPLEPLVRLVTSETGGEIVDARSGGSLTQALEEIIHQFKLRYTIGYSPTESEKDGLLRTIEVRLAEQFGDAGKNYTTRHRRGYYAVDRNPSIETERRQ